MEQKKNHPCPECRRNGHDKDGDHLYLLSSGNAFFCNKSQYHLDKKNYWCNVGTDGLPDTYVSRDKPIEPPVLNKTPEFVSKNFSSEEIRGIPKHIVEMYGVKCEFDVVTGEVSKHYYPVTQDGKLVTYKGREVATKNFFALQKGFKEVDLFGRLSCTKTPGTLVITEGELDAMAAYHMLSQHKINKLMCVSLPHGANPHDISRNLKWIMQAKRIVICPDQDAVGTKFVENVVKLIPTALVMKFDEKDPCDMLKAGKTGEFVDSYDNSKAYVPSCIVTIKDVLKEAMAPVEYGLAYPWTGLDNMTFGLRERRIIGIGAGPGCGKTSIIAAIQQHIIKTHKIPIGVFPLEQSPGEYARELAGIILNIPLFSPECKPGRDYDETVVQKVLTDLEPYLFMYDHEGYKDWADIETSIRYMHSLGVMYFFIDPLSALANHLEPSDANVFLNRALGSMMELKDSLGVTIFHINHLNNPTGGKDHGAGGKVYAGQFSGSRAMWKYSTDLWGAERNQLSEDPEERNTTRIVSLKYRKPSRGGSFLLKYDDKTGTMREVLPTGGF